MLITVSIACLLTYQNKSSCLCLDSRHIYEEGGRIIK